jgi:alpha-ketoglutarate-dependent taurine dioxygenase
MVVYRSRIGERADKSTARRLGERFGLTRLDSNWLADDDGITSLMVNPQGPRPRYIPYTDRPISWHTDGYYNPPDRQIRGLLLHCVRPAAEGGENRLFDSELAYIALRDEDPAFIRALMMPDAMTIPPGTAADGSERGAAVGPVFSVFPDGRLHMRYTARKRTIFWKDDAALQGAVSRLEALLADDDVHVFRARLEAGMGLVANNCLHDRSGFTDSGQGRLLYRARYYDRVAGT